MRFRFLFCGVLACGPLVCATVPDEAADRAAFQKVCGACHAITMVTDLKTESEWSETIDQMASIGAKGSVDEFGRVARYLSRNYTKVNINTGTAAQIAPVLDISESEAQLVVSYRTAHGRFSSLEELARLPGLDARALESRKARIAFR